MRQPRCLPQRQQGVALIIALVLVALATILATKLSFDGFLERQRSVGVLAAEQALQFGRGAEALAADVLSQQTNAQTVTLSDAWAQGTQALPITPPNDPEGEPIGTLQGSLEDMQGRFNLNNLAHLVNNQPDPQPLAIFQRLLVAVGVEPKWAGMARDWIDQDQTVGAEDGAEDSVYMGQVPPYRTGNWPMLSPSELMNLPGFGADRYRKIAPYVTALPLANATINICTAPAVVLESLADNLNGEIGDADALANGRRNGCFPDAKTLQNIVGAKTWATLSPAVVGTASSFFELTTRVELGTSEFTLYSLLARTNGNKVTPIVRSFGTR